MQPAIYRLNEVLELFKISKATLWRWRRAGDFPDAIQLGPNVVAFRRDEIDAWLAARPRAQSQSVNGVDAAKAA